MMLIHEKLPPGRLYAQSTPLATSPFSLLGRVNRT